MIQSAMMFALGIFVSGLVWLAFSAALVRRARRLTERRLLAGIATRRAEFETERDELRARHAVQMHRLEREVSRVLDMATAHRLEADLKERDLVNLKAELSARVEDNQYTEYRLQGERDIIQNLERRNAEVGTTMRSLQHALALESKRRTIAEEALDEASIRADQRRLAITALRGENNALRKRLGEPPGAPVPFELDEPKLPSALSTHAVEETPHVDTTPVMPEAVPATEIAPAAESAPAAEKVAASATPAEPVDDVATPLPQTGGSVVPMPKRPRQGAPASPDQSAAAVAAATKDLQRMAGKVDIDTGEGFWRVPPKPQPQMPAAAATAVTGNVGELVALRLATPGSGDNSKPKTVDENAESRFFEALAEIRALKRTANQAGE